MIVNLQRKVKLEARGYAGFLAEALAAIEEAEGGEAAVAFVSDRRMRELNKLFRGIDATTDVLSFPHEPDDFDAAPTYHQRGDPVPERIAVIGIAEPRAKPPAAGGRRSP